MLKHLNVIVTSNPDLITIRDPKRRQTIILMWLYFFLVLTTTIASMSVAAFLVKSEFSQSIFEVVFLTLLIFDYIARFITAKERNPKGKFVYLKHFFKWESLMLLVALLPSLYLIGVWIGSDSVVFTAFKGMQFLRIFRLILLLNIFTVLRLFKKVLATEWKLLTGVFGFILLVIVLFALTIYSIESPAATKYLQDNPTITQSEAENSGYIFTYWQAIYYSTITLTTIGFGDFHPHTQTGQVVTVVMSIFGVAIIATPTGIIAAGFNKAFREARAAKKND